MLRKSLLLLLVFLAVLTLGLSSVTSRWPMVRLWRVSSTTLVATALHDGHADAFYATAPNADEVDEFLALLHDSAEERDAGRLAAEMHSDPVFEGQGQFALASAKDGGAVRFPLWLPALLFTCYPAIATFRGPILRWYRRRRMNFCIRCGYNLTGVTAESCPGCARPMPDAHRQCPDALWDDGLATAHTDDSLTAPQPAGQRKGIP